MIYLRVIFIKMLLVYDVFMDNTFIKNVKLYYEALIN